MMPRVPVAFLLFFCVLLAPLASIHAVGKGGKYYGHARNRWEVVKPVEGGEPVRIRVALVQPPDGLDRMRNLLLRVSDPRSPDYGNHLTINDITPFVAPAPQHLQVCFK